MRYSTGNDFMTSPVGIFVTMTESASELFSFSVEAVGLYRKNVTFRFAPSEKGEWYKQIISALNTIQRGCRWTVHFDFTDTEKYLTDTELRLIECAFPLVTFICHRSAASFRAELSPEEIEREEKKEASRERHRIKQRERYQRKKAVAKC